MSKDDRNKWLRALSQRVILVRSFSKDTITHCVFRYTLCLQTHTVSSETHCVFRNTLCFQKHTVSSETHCVFKYTLCLKNHTLRRKKMFAEIHTVCEIKHSVQKYILNLISSLSYSTGSFLNLGKQIQRETFLIHDGKCKLALHHWPVLPRTGDNIGF